MGRDADAVKLWSNKKEQEHHDALAGVRGEEEG